MISTLSLNDIKLKNVFFQHLVIIAAGVVIFYVEEVEFADVFWTKLILMVMAFGKCIYFLGHSFKKIEEASVNDITYNKFLIIILTNVLLIVISFTVDYTCLMQIDPNSYVGLAEPESIVSNVFDFLYNSILSFATVGYGDILPKTKAAKMLVMMEVVVAYITTIIIISNFVLIKESIKDTK